ncbi:MAG: hypothetical protein AAGH64_00115 [Planctomycetota bacterium]
MRARTLLMMTALPALLAASGCNIVGAAGVIVWGPPKVAAATTLYDERTTVLLVDDLNSVLPRASLRDRIGRAAEGAMLRQKVIEEGKLVSSASARRVVSGDTNEARTSIVDAGRAVRAEVVVHVAILGWTMSSTPGEVSPQAVVGVKILDAMSNERIWPAGEASFVRSVELPVRADREMGSGAQRRQIEDDLADRVGQTIAKLFYESERERISEQRGA